MNVYHQMCVLGQQINQKHQVVHVPPSYKAAEPLKLRSPGGASGFPDLPSRTSPGEAKQPDMSNITVNFHHLCHQQHQYLKGCKEHKIHKYLAS